MANSITMTYKIITDHDITFVNDNSLQCITKSKINKQALGYAKASPEEMEIPIITFYMQNGSKATLEFESESNRDKAFKKIAFATLRACEVIDISKLK